MTRLTSIERGGFYALPACHLQPIATLFSPTPHGGRLLDPCAGEGEALQYLADAWHLTPYANELDVKRAAVCQRLFGTRAVQGDMYQLRASNGAFVGVWCNPPYAWDTTGEDPLQTGAGKRRELSMLKESWKWAQPGGWVLWVVYAHHITQDAAMFLARHSTHVDIWRLPGLHMDTYQQVVAVCKTGEPAGDPKDIALALVEARMAGAFPELTPQASPRYEFPAPQASKTFVFAPNVLTAEHVLLALEQDNAQRLQGFQDLIAPPRPLEKIRPVVRPRAGQLALILAAGMFNGLVLDTTHGRAAVRSTARAVEQLVGRENADDEESGTDRETYRTQQVVTITLLTERGQVIDVSGDSAVVGFINAQKAALMAYIDRELEPLYHFDYSPLAPVLARAKGGRLYPVQKHIIAACHAALQQQRGIIMVGEMGTGKTALGATLAATLLPQMRPEQCVIISCPPHLTSKWQRELLEAAPNVAVPQILKDTESVRAFMDKATTLGAGKLKVGILSRERAKLGEGWDIAVNWRKEYLVRWRPGEEPDNAEGSRVITLTRPLCPTCGEPIQRENGEIANLPWLQRRPRFCPRCHGALWSITRTFSAPDPAKGEKYPKRNPRTPLAEFIAKRYPGRVYLYIADEIHESKSNCTDQGEAMMTLANAAEKVVGLTGTVYGGLASTLYTIEFVFNPRVRAAYPWGASGLTDWIRVMGCLERVVEYKPQFDKAGKFSGKRRVEYSPKEAPGCSPLLVRELVDHAIFFSLNDMGRAMPPYTEIPVPIEPDPQVAALYDEAKQKLGEYLFKCRMEGDSSALGMYLQTLLSWPSAPWREEQCIHRRRIDRESDEFTEILVHTIPALSEDRLYPKEQWLVDLVRAELAEGRGVAIFVRQTGTRDIQPRIERILREHVPLAKPYILKSSVPADKREAVLAQQVAAGINVIVGNPKLCATGIDMLDFQTIVFAEVDYSLYTMSQASRRAWRLIQTRECRTYYPFYTGLMEHQAVELVGRKQSAANLLYGETGAAGLSALSGGGSGSLLAELAAAVDRDETVIDLRDLFAAHAHQVDPAESAWFTVEEAPQPAEVIEVPTLEISAAESTPGPEPETPANPLLPEPAPFPREPFASTGPQPVARPSVRTSLNMEPLPLGGGLQIGLFDILLPPAAESASQPPVPEPVRAVGQQLSLF